jgi:tRNA/rRNA methyltransferase
MSITPTIILVRPQMAENIGAAARAMANFGIKELRLVAPRDGWPNENAHAMAAGGLPLLEKATLHRSVAEALQDCHVIYATSARLRDLHIMHHSPRTIMETIAGTWQKSKHAVRVAFLFGAENNGLTNAEAAYAHALIHIPASPAYNVLNIAQAVGIVCYEWYQIMHTIPASSLSSPIHAPVTHGMITGLFDTICTTLSLAGYPPEIHQRIKLLQMLLRLPLMEQDINALHGIIRCIAVRD